MSQVLDYTSRVSDPASRKFETFSYLPAMSDAEIRKQVEYIVSKGWNPAIEHTEPQYLMDNYWYMWKLPLFGETDVDGELKEEAKAALATLDERFVFRLLPSQLGLGLEGGVVAGRDGLEFGDGGLEAVHFPVSGHQRLDGHGLVPSMCGCVGVD